MPAKQRLRPHGEDNPGGSRQVAAQGREHETVRWEAAHSLRASAEHTDLLSEHDQLEADGPVAPESGGCQVGGMDAPEVGFPLLATAAWPPASPSLVGGKADHTGAVELAGAGGDSVQFGRLG